MSSASTSHARGESVDLVHPRRGLGPRRHRVREEAGDGERLRDALAELPRQAGRPCLAVVRQPVAGLPLERRRAVLEHLAGDPRGLAQHGLVAGLGQRTRRRRDAAARAGDLLVRDAGDLLLVLGCAPPRERQVGVAVDEPRHHGAARRVHEHVGARVVLERRDAVAAHRDRARVEAHRRCAVAAHVGQPGLRRLEKLCGAAQRDAHAIGIRTPCRSAAASASG